MEGIGRDLF